MNNIQQNKGRVAILLSGRGSNFEAIYQFSQQAAANFQVIAVISDNAEAHGLITAKNWGLPTYFVNPKQLKNKTIYEQKIVDILKNHHTQLVCLAGYMRIVGETLLNAYPGLILNIHPALLPSFPGTHAQQQALDHGVKISGCTVHFVDPGIDSGPIILQNAVTILENDTEDSLASRILTQEHQLYSEAISLFFQKRLNISGRRVIISS